MCYSGSRNSPLDVCGEKSEITIRICTDVRKYNIILKVTCKYAMYITREIEEQVRKLAGCYPIVTVTGPRQSGKTTLIRHLFPDHSYFNLETRDVRDMIMEDPKSFVVRERGPMILDEVQKLPQILEYIQVEADRNPEKGRFILTGSHQPELEQAVSESLAGRTGIVELLPLSFAARGEKFINLFVVDECASQVILRDSSASD